MFKKILVAFDGSEASKRALNYAADMAYEAKGQLIIPQSSQKLHYPYSLMRDSVLPPAPPPRTLENTKTA